MPLQQNALPSLLDRTQELIREARFFISSIPNVEPDIANSLIRQLQASRIILADLRDFSLLSKEELNQCVQFIDNVLKPLREYLHSQSSADRYETSSLPKTPTGNPGPGRYSLDLARILELHDMGNTWNDIARIYGIHRATLHRHIVNAGLQTAKIPYSDIPDHVLDCHVTEISKVHPTAGSIIMQGHLRSIGLNIELNRIRASLRRVDEDGVALRFRHATRRRVYKVRGSNALWHQDGNEKLKPWGFYVHGCVDGHSRLVIYLVCTNNKRAKTVGDCFRHAVSVFGWPSRVRGDFGTENNQIELLMVERWGVAHHAYLRGRSVHNVRIERFWRDVRKDSLEFFRRIFLLLEELHLLNPDSRIHLVCLYLVYRHRIQKSLDETKTSWNNHALRTERYKTPLALYELSRQQAINAGYWYGDAGDSVIDIDEHYGTEDPETARSEGGADEAAAGVVVTEDEHIEEGRSALFGMDFESDDGAWGIDIYCEAVMRLSTYYSSSSTSTATS